MNAPYPITPGAPSLYQLLGVPPDATTDAIDSAWYERARALSPALNPNPAAAAHYAAVEYAWHTLRSPERRAEYDQLLAQAPAPSPHLRVAYRAAALATQVQAQQPYHYDLPPAGEDWDGDDTTEALPFRFEMAMHLAIALAFVGLLALVFIFSKERGILFNGWMPI